METILNAIFSGQSLALLGAALAAGLAGMGSAKAVGMVGESASGLLSENPSMFGKVLLLEALPGTQGIYGLITAFVIFIQTGLLSGNMMELTMGQGLYLFIACLPIAIVGYFSAIKQGRVAVSGVSLLAKQADAAGKAITSAALVETYAIFALLVSLLMIINF